MLVRHGDNKHYHKQEVQKEQGGKKIFLKGFIPWEVDDLEFRGYLKVGLEG